MAAFNTLKIALIADELTHSSLGHECQIRDVTPQNYTQIFQSWKPDLLFVESAWHEYLKTWKYQIASQPLYLYPWRNNLALRKVVAKARDLGIPTVFWNKEDSVHFNRFINSAKLFDYIFTVDVNCLERYRAVVGPEASVKPLLFAIQPATHNFTGFDFKFHRANFVGSYSRHIHDRRRSWQHMLFEASAGLGVTVFDRNSGRKPDKYRYPLLPNMEILPAVSHAKTAAIYKDYLVSMNVNTIEDSPTMFSRRLVEILACGGIAVTTPSQSVEALFKDYCHVVSDSEEALALFERLRYGPSPDDLERARAGAEYVLREHTWTHRLEEILQIVG